jgi:hypothetical protein
LKNGLNDIKNTLRKLRLGHFILALTSLPVALSIISLALGDIPKFLMNLLFTSGLCLFLIYVEAKYMEKHGLI